MGKYSSCHNRFGCTMKYLLTVLVVTLGIASAAPLSWKGAGRMDMAYFRRMSQPGGGWDEWSKGIGSGTKAGDLARACLAEFDAGKTSVLIDNSRCFTSWEGKVFPYPIIWLKACRIVCADDDCKAQLMWDYKKTDSC